MSYCIFGVVPSETLGTFLFQSKGLFLFATSGIAYLGLGVACFLEEEIRYCNGRIRDVLKSVGSAFGYGLLSGWPKR